jgi:hypothetical protein
MLPDLLFSQNSCGYFGIFVLPYEFFLVVVGFEFSALELLENCSTT